MCVCVWSGGGGGMKTCWWGVEVEMDWGTKWGMGGGYCV